MAFNGGIKNFMQGMVKDAVNGFGDIKNVVKSIPSNAVQFGATKKGVYDATKNTVNAVKENAAKTLDELKTKRQEVLAFILDLFAKKKKEDPEYELIIRTKYENILSLLSDENKKKLEASPDAMLYLLVSLHPVDAERTHVNTGGIGSNGNQVKEIKGAPSAQHLADVISKFPNPSNTAFYANLSELDKHFGTLDPKIQKKVAESLMNAFKNDDVAKHFEKKFSEANGAKYIELAVKHPEMLDLVAKGIENKNPSDEFNQLDFEDTNSPYDANDKADIEKMFSDEILVNGKNKLKTGRDNEKAATKKQQDGKKSKSGEPYTMLKVQQYIPDIDERTMYSQLKVCYTSKCGKGEYVIFDEAYVKYDINTDKVDIIGCDTKLTSNAPWTANQNANLELRKGNASLNKSTTPPKVLYPADLKYEIRGKDDKKGLLGLNASGEEVKNDLSTFKNKNLIISKILKLECDGNDKGNVTKIEKY